MLPFARVFAYSHLCSRSVAWISHTLTKERRFLSSVQFSDKQMLPIVWASSRSLDAWVILYIAQIGWCHKHKNQYKYWSGTNLFLYVLSRPTLHVPDEILTEVRGKGRGERAGGPCCRGSGGSRGWTGSSVDAGCDVIGTWRGTPLTAGINTVQSRQHEGRTEQKHDCIHTGLDLSTAVSQICQHRFLYSRAQSASKHCTHNTANKAETYEALREASSSKINAKNIDIYSWVCNTNWIAIRFKVLCATRHWALTFYSLAKTFITRLTHI